MERTHNFKLIDGVFEPKEARNILFALVNSKINFHSMESFGISIRTSGDISFHEKRINELAQANVDIKKIMAYADEHNLSLRIDGTIEIKFLDESKE